MAMKDKTTTKQNRFDSTKASLFIIFAVIFIVAPMIYFVFVPDIRKLKFSVMTKERTEITLSQTRAEAQLQEANLAETRATNLQILNRLRAKFSTDLFHKEISKFFSNAEIKKLNEKPIKHKTLPNVEYDNYSIEAELKEPNNFYDFADFLKNYGNIIELSLPFQINADSAHLLKWDFIIRVYYAKEEQGAE
ncbi:MAG: hypothetical protein LBU73_09215 [Helicobacteraceae bacterium]|jgi:hypothetical protein|nr:hypothetical protein [Helicobacteraceae bacterium]